MENKDRTSNPDQKDSASSKEPKKVAKAKSVQSKTICWDCANATGRCPWSSKLQPIAGWQAIQVEIKTSKKDPKEPEEETEIENPKEEDAPAKDPAPANEESEPATESPEKPEEPEEPEVDYTYIVVQCPLFKPDARNYGQDRLPKVKTGKSVSAMLPEEDLDDYPDE